MEKSTKTEEEIFAADAAEEEMRNKCFGLKVQMNLFLNITSMSPRLCIYENKAETSEKKSMKIPDKVMEAGINAMKKEFKKEIKTMEKQINDLYE